MVILNGGCLWININPAIASYTLTAIIMCNDIMLQFNIIPCHSLGSKHDVCAVKLTGLGTAIPADCQLDNVGVLALHTNRPSLPLSALGVRPRRDAG